MLAAVTSKGGCGAVSPYLLKTVQKVSIYYHPAQTVCAQTISNEIKTIF